MKANKFSKVFFVAAAFFPALELAADEGKLAFAKYRVSKEYTGKIVLPDFRGRDRQYAILRTRLSNGLREGPNFAGKFTVVQIGCGTGCSSIYIGDVTTGKIFSFPLGGEDFSYLNPQFRIDSRLIVAFWEADGRCKRASYEWLAGKFNAIEQSDQGSNSDCIHIAARQFGK